MKLDFKPQISELSSDQTPIVYRGFDVTATIPRGRIAAAIESLKQNIVHNPGYLEFETYTCIAIAAPEYLAEFADTKLPMLSAVTAMLDGARGTMTQYLFAICFWVKLNRPDYDFSRFITVGDRDAMVDRYNNLVNSPKTTSEAAWLALVIKALFPDTVINLDLIDTHLLLEEIVESRIRRSSSNTQTLLAVKMLFPDLMTPEFTNELTAKMETELLVLSFALPSAWPRFWGLAAVLTLLNCNLITLNENGLHVISSAINSTAVLPEILHIS